MSYRFFRHGTDVQSPVVSFFTWLYTARPVIETFSLWYNQQVRDLSVSMWKESWFQYGQESINIKKQIGHTKTHQLISRKMFTFTKNLVLLFENNQIITASRIMILTYNMTINERFNTIGVRIIIFEESLWEVSPKRRTLLIKESICSKILERSDLMLP